MPFKKNEWTEEHTKAFEQAKRAIGNAKMLSYLDYSKPIFCRTDASDVGAGGMLYQKKDGRDLPVAFFSRTFTATERRWSVFEKETYALTAAILQWESLLLSPPRPSSAPIVKRCLLPKTSLERFRTI